MAKSVKTKGRWNAGSQRVLINAQNRINIRFHCSYRGLPIGSGGGSVGVESSPIEEASS